MALHPKAERVLAKRNYPPGQHGPKGRGKMTDYGAQLAEKQKAKLVYGILEKQFRNYYAEAVRQPGDSGVNLVRLLETRLDTVIYRLGFGQSQPQARQMVNHSHFRVNGKRVDVPSFQVKANDVITVRQSSAKSKMFTNLAERLKSHDQPVWLSLDADTMTAKVLDLPAKGDIKPVFDIKAIIEFYSR